MPPQAFCPLGFRQFNQAPPIGSPQGFMPPSGPPPLAVPQENLYQMKAVSPASLGPCRRRLAYLWLNNGRSFWAWIANVDRRNVSGWRWNGRSWVRFTMDLRRIRHFACF
ncbi:hypothetical protein [Clostridium sp. JN-9]|uniref:hypothetical protein n=1 Tax=Clostridium sp. JN-9 TaxID=2507159 RepID=UPI001FAA262F|nr:hypothetical protein [Clostridium sp. JN-9]